MVTRRVTNNTGVEEYLTKKRTTNQSNTAVDTEVLLDLEQSPHLRGGELELQLLSLLGLVQRFAVECPDFEVHNLEIKREDGPAETRGDKKGEKNVRLSYRLSGSVTVRTETLMKRSRPRRCGHYLVAWPEESGIHITLVVQVSRKVSEKKEEVNTQ